MMNENHNDKLETIISELKERGASSVVPINVADIAVDERVRLKCRVPLCDSYHQNLMCPPYVPTVAEFREVLNRYSMAILIQVSAELEKTYANAPTEEVFVPAKKLHELVNFGEKEAFTAGFRFASSGAVAVCVMNVWLLTVAHDAGSLSRPGLPWRLWGSMSWRRRKKQVCLLILSPSQTGSPGRA
jgi:predicted metal-binding protein